MLPPTLDAESACYALTLPCGCRVKVSRRPGFSGSRLIERRADSCGRPTHDPGARVYLWELLPPRRVERDSEPRRRQLLL